MSCTLTFSTTMHQNCLRLFCQATWREFTALPHSPTAFRGDRGAASAALDGSRGDGDATAPILRSHHRHYSAYWSIGNDNFLNCFSGEYAEYWYKCQRPDKLLVVIFHLSGEIFVPINNLTVQANKLGNHRHQVYA